MPCEDGFYYTNNNTNCTQCAAKCRGTCTDATVCTSCTLTGSNKAYLLNSTCYSNCPNNYFNDDNAGSGPNICMPCAAQCLTCTGNPNPCQSCNDGYYLYLSSCDSTCPTGYIAFDPTWQCLDCNIHCVELTITMSFSDSMSNKLYIDMQFSRVMDFNTFDY